MSSSNSSQKIYPFVLLMLAGSVHSAPPVSQVDSLPAISSVVNTITGSAAGDDPIDEVKLTIRDDDFGYYWNGSAFQSNPAEVNADLTGSGNNVNWSYTFSEPLASGQYNVSSVAVDAANSSQSTPDNESFSITHYFTSTGDGSWGPVIPTPSIPVAAANLPNGKILHWAAYKVDDYKPATKDFGQTYTSIFDPVTGQSTLDLVTETQHDMFCMGANILEDGTVLMNGGNSHGQTSIFDSASGNWTSEDPMNIPRAYQGNAMLEDGRILTLGGSWKFSPLCRGQFDNSGTCVDKTAEIWDPDNGWSVLNGISPNPLTTDDVDGLFRSDNHMWLFSIPGGKVLHAGPSRNMHLLDVSGNGSITSAGTRANDADAMNGNAVMYDIGKILTTGGAPNYENDDATTSAFVIAASGNNVSTRRVSSMTSQRAYHNSVVLPNGEVIVVGGQAYPAVFSDDQSAMKPELWNPVSETFRELVPMQVPRNYHSVALLTQDGRVLAGGGGLCGTCNNKNHPDIEILTPPYLYDSDGNLAQRPSITSAPASATYGDVINVTTDSNIKSIVLMRASAVTHSVNNAQRRIPLDFTRTADNNNLASIPTDSASAIPGSYMLFVLDDNGVPSVGKTINIRHDAANQDSDGDGIADSLDPFPFDPDNDIDGDNISGHIDNCPVDSNPDQSDVDADGIGDVCDSTDNRPDSEFSAQLMDNRFDVCVEVEQASTQDGANVQASACSTTTPVAAHQIFDFVLVPGFTDTYTIQPRHSGLCLAVDGGATSNTANIIQESCSNADQQQFRLIIDLDGNYAIKTNTGDGSKVLDASADLEPDGVTRNLQQFTDAAKGNQRWTFSIQDSNDSNDTTDPVVTIDSPSDGTTFLPQTMDIEGTATDDDSGVEKVLVRIQNRSSAPWSYWNGSTYQTSAIWLTAELNDNNWTLNDADFPDSGDYRILLRAYDNAGNHTNWDNNPQSRVTIGESDTTGPVVYLNSPTNGVEIQAQFLDIEGLASDDISGINRVQVRVQNRSSNQWSYWNGASYQNNAIWVDAILDSDDNWLLPDVDFSSIGEYRILLRAYDNNDNLSDWHDNPRSDFTVVEADSTIPFVSIDFPRDDAVITPQISDIEGSASDNASGVDRVLVRVQNRTSNPRSYWNGVYYQSGAVWVNATLDSNSNWHIPNVNLTTIGDYRILLRAYDSAGNHAQWSDNQHADITVINNDTAKPQVTINTPQDGGIITPQITNIEGTAFDDATGVDRVLVRVQNRNTSPMTYWNGSTFQTTAIWIHASLDSNSNWLLPNVDLTDTGNYRILLRAYDNAGNHANWFDNPRSDFSSQPLTP